MLSMPKVINFVKKKLGFPHVVIELSDSEIEEQIIFSTLNEFSKYLPHTNELVLDTMKAENKTVQENVFYLHDEDECDIIGVSEVIFPETILFLQGYPFYGPITTIDEVPSMLINVLNAENAEQFSKTSLIFEYMVPNKLRIFHSMIPDKFVVRYQRVHPETLHTIPTEHQMEFQYLALADTMQICGHIRNKYTNISTPFGDIPLGTDVASAGDALKDKVIEKLETLPPNVIFHIG